MSWDWVWWLVGAIVVLVTVMTIINIIGGSEDESREAKQLVVQILAGLGAAAVLLLLVTFVVKPTMVFIAQSVWYVFN
jgi:negative regulator of sigma E activity